MSDDDRIDSDIDNDNKEVEKDNEEDSRDQMDIDKDKHYEKHDANIGRNIPIKHRITSRFLTKYEKVRIIGERAIQLSNNAIAMVTVDKDMWDPLKIAEKELKERKIPFQIRRYLPNGDYEDWNVNDLIFD